MRVASFDIGSNSVIMLVAERATDGSWSAVEDHVDVARISEGLDRSGVLAENAIERTATILRRFAARAAELGVEHVVATGTAPFRRGTNGAEVAARLSTIIGADIEVVSGEREAQLALLATSRSFPALEDMLVVDIGGASTELVRARAHEAPRMVSLDIGSVRLTERCVSAAPLNAADRAHLERVIDHELARADVLSVLEPGGTPVVGIAGTVTTVLTVALEMHDYDAARVHGHAMKRSTVDEVFERLALMSVESRSALAGLEPKRADVLPAGALLLSRILAAAGVDSVTVSDRGARWGRVFEL